MKLHCERVNCTISTSGEGGNAYVLLGKWQYAAQKEGRTDDEIKAVLYDAMSSDYNHLLYVLSEHSK
jgi:hypothetical protein